MKMYCVFARESLEKINGVRGKLATQAGHAYLHGFMDSLERFHDDALRYFNGRAYKITLVVDTVQELQELEQTYRDLCGVHLVTDAGFTVFKEPTTTCIGIGPLADELKGADLANMKVLT